MPGVIGVESAFEQKKGGVGGPVLEYDGLESLIEFLVLAVVVLNGLKQLITSFVNLYGWHGVVLHRLVEVLACLPAPAVHFGRGIRAAGVKRFRCAQCRVEFPNGREYPSDRKSTRLNSSH